MKDLFFYDIRYKLCFSPVFYVKMMFAQSQSHFYVHPVLQSWNPQRMDQKSALFSGTTLHFVS